VINSGNSSISDVRKKPLAAPSWSRDSKKMEIEGEGRGKLGDDTGAKRLIKSLLFCQELLLTDE
jgi:hypothetical protein